MHGDVPQKHIFLCDSYILTVGASFYFVYKVDFLVLGHLILSETPTRQKWIVETSPVLGAKKRKLNIGRTRQNDSCKSKVILCTFIFNANVNFCRKEYVQREFDDYTTDSQQLEKEYEATIEQHEKTIRELRSANSKLQNEIESLRLKLEQATKENVALQNSETKLKNESIEMQRYIRTLEQKNDDLERSERAHSESIQAIEAALNMAIEKNAMLESEVDEKETLKEKFQRVVDEARGRWDSRHNF